MTVDVETLRRWLESGRKLTILDVRPAAERAEWSIPGSIHLDAYASLRAGTPSGLDTLPIPAGATVVTVCARGRTSLIAMEALKSRGMTAYSLAGGMKAWSVAWNAAELPPIVRGVRVVQVRRTGKGCISHLVAAGADAVVIDACVQTQVYLDVARDNGWRIVSVVDTHIHADHLSRSRALADAAGAQLFLPRQGRVSFPFNALDDGDAIPVGPAGLLTALATPGHTGESMCFLLGGAVLFTGDTLFLGSVGRPDLEGGMEKAESMCRRLYSSIQRLLTMPRETTVLPSHVSAPIPFDELVLQGTLGRETDGNPLLGMPEEEFVAAILRRIPSAPPNFNRILDCNLAGLLPEGDPTDLEAGANRCAVG